MPTSDDAILQELRQAARAAGAINEDDFVKLVDRSELTVADDGSVPGTSALVERVRRDKAYLFAAGAAMAAAAKPGGSDAKRKAVQDMTDAEFRQAVADLNRPVLRRGFDKAALDKITGGRKATELSADEFRAASALLRRGDYV